MANYSNLKAAIAAAIKTNGNQEITGQVLQDVLTSMVSVIGANYTFAGVATPSTNPSTPDQNVVYMASQAGTYTNFGGIELPAGISLLMWNGAWTAQTFFALDDVPTYGSNNLVKSGGVFGDIHKISKNWYEKQKFTKDLSVSTSDLARTVELLENVNIPASSVFEINISNNNLITWAEIKINSSSETIMTKNISQNTKLYYHSTKLITDISIYIPAGNITGNGTVSFEITVSTYCEELYRKISILGNKVNCIYDENSLILSNKLLLANGSVSNVNGYATSGYIPLDQNAESFDIFNVFPKATTSGGYTGICFFNSKHGLVGYSGSNNRVSPFADSVDVREFINKGAAYFRFSSEINGYNPLLVVNAPSYEEKNRIDNAYKKIIKLFDKSGLHQGYFDVSGVYAHNSSYTDWGCFKNLINLFNTEKIIIRLKTPINLNGVTANFYQYSYSYDSENIQETYTPYPQADTNKQYPVKDYIEIDVSTWNCYARLSLSANDSSVTILDSVSSIEVYAQLKSDYVASVEDSCKLLETTPNTAGLSGRCVVDVNGTGDYTDLGTAYNAHRTGSNPALIMFDMKNGEYGRVSVQELWIHGECREYTIMKNLNAVYPNGALNCGVGQIENMTFYSTNPDSEVRQVYALHIDTDYQYNKTCYFRNCRFIADGSSAIGIGMTSGYNLVFEDCEFICNAENTAAYFHDARPSLEHKGGLQWITFKNCKFISQWDYALSIHSTYSQNKLIATFINNTFYSKTQGTNNIVKVTGTPTQGFLCGDSILLGNDSHGNNVELLNA